jgi:hypothetical protein
VTKISEGALILKDTMHTAAGAAEKQKLVQLYPDQNSWVATHLAGPNRYSQFLYQITSDGKGGSFLDFTALHLEYDSKEPAEVLAARLCQQDREVWKRLATALSEELAKPR